MPLIARRYGVEVFGELALTTNFAYLIGNIINFGTNQTEIKKVSINRDNKHQLSLSFSNTFWLRMFIFILTSIISIIFIILLCNSYFLVWLSIFPLLIAEIINPIYFLIGIEKVNWITWGNIISRTISFFLIYLISLKFNESILLNLFIGTPILFFYLLIMLFLIKKYQLKFIIPNIGDIRSNLQVNSRVTFNGSVGMLQQSIFLFFIANKFSIYVLGAYAIVDKLLNVFRQIISLFSTSIYPRSSQIFHESKLSWRAFRYQIQKFYIYFSLLTGLIFYNYSENIILLITNDSNEITSYFIKLLSPSLLFLSMNANNVLDFLLNEQYEGMFIVSILILITTVLISYLLSYSIINLSIGWYPLMIESSCFLIYSIAVKKYKLNAI